MILVAPTAFKGTHSAADVAAAAARGARASQDLEVRELPVSDGGPGLIDSLIAGGNAGSFDFAFIDADKENYDGYYERALVLLRPGGLVAVDNVLWSGAVADPQDKNATTEAIRRLNRKILRDKRVAISLVPIGDGLTLARKLP